MFHKKLKSEDLDEVKRRDELIRSHRLIVSALKIQNQIYLNGILPKYGCDLNKKYEIDIKTGKIKEVKKK